MGSWGGPVNRKILPRRIQEVAQPPETAHLELLDGWLERARHRTDEFSPARHRPHGDLTTRGLTEQRLKVKGVTLPGDGEATTRHRCALRDRWALFGFLP